MPDNSLTSSEQISSDANGQLANLLYRYAPATLLASQGIAIIVSLAIYHQLAPTTLYLWLSSVTLFNLLRLGLRYLKSPPTVAGLLTAAWINRYVILTLFAGLSWASLLFFFDPRLPFFTQLLIVITVAAMPVAALPNNAIWLPVYHAFAIPNLFGLLIWALFVVENFMLEYTSLTLAYALVLLITAHTYHKNLRQALEAKAQNERLIAQLSEANKHLEDFAYIDPLTGLTNRRWFQEQADNALERCQRHNSSLALILIDLDNFKQINDELGHAGGDEVLVTIAKRLKSTFRQTDSIAHAQMDAARFGGDEFIVLLEDIKSSADVKKAAQRVLNEVHEPLIANGKTVELSCSMGIALYPADGNTITTLIRRADVALYRVKDSGRNNFQFYDDTLVSSTH
jgi:diguanylate cyclase (GGDEF)-like protein